MEPQTDLTTTLESSELRYLDPKELRFFRHGATMRLTVSEEVSYLKVTVMRAFPLTEPHRYLSVRYGEKGEKEVGVIACPRDLEPNNRRLIDEELDRRYLVPVIQRVVGVNERFGTQDWEVETDRGICRFTTRHLRENLVQPSSNRFLLTDVDGNRFDIPDLMAMDAASQGWLTKHL